MTRTNNGITNDSALMKNDSFSLNFVSLSQPLRNVCAMTIFSDSSKSSGIKRTATSNDIAISDIFTLNAFNGLTNTNNALAISDGVVVIVNNAENAITNINLNVIMVATDTCDWLGVMLKLPVDVKNSCTKNVNMKKNLNALIDG